MELREEIRTQASVAARYFENLLAEWRRQAAEDYGDEDADDAGEAFVELENVPDEPVSSSITIMVGFDGGIDWSIVNRLIDAASCTGELQVTSRDAAQTHVVLRLGRQPVLAAENSDEEELAEASEGPRAPLEVAAYREPRGYAVPMYRPVQYMGEEYIVPPPPVAPPSPQPSTPIAYSDLVEQAKNSVSANTELACHLLDLLDLCDNDFIKPKCIHYCPISRNAMWTLWSQRTDTATSAVSSRSFSGRAPQPRGRGHSGGTIPLPFDGRAAGHDGRVPESQPGKRHLQLLRWMPRGKSGVCCR